ncbi:GAF domain-containing protein [Streptomyces sp. NPDC102467]|uniref:sensor histidine kinase n=1 Tax=Streptomyces sp. NPDC102467 TaxID=3366179 RepID=UPI003806412A
MGGDRGSGEQTTQQLRLDVLLEELQGRIDVLRVTRDRIHALLEAVMSVGRGLDLSQALRRIVEAAVVLVDAEYGALGVVEQSRLSEFVPVGIDEELWQQIGELPQGHGILGELIRHPEPLRLAELAEHPASYGFPEHHPPMHAFLGVPIRVRDEVFGNLYLTEKRGAKEFDTEDESVLSTLAVAAGVAIENARLYEEGQRKERWLAAGAEVTERLLSGRARADVLRLIVERAREIVNADVGIVVVPVEGAQGLRTALAVGVDAQRYEGLQLPGDDGFVKAAFAGVEPVVSDDIGHDPRSGDNAGHWADCGPAVAVPIEGGEAARGVLLLVRRSGRVLFTGADTEPLQAFCGQAALVMELADRRRDAEQVVLVEDRDRIARDLHDLAIQRLFATGMTLQSAQRVARQPEVEERLERAVHDLDTTIKIIRSTIFGLRVHEGGPGASGLRARLASAVAAVSATLGFPPALRMEGLVDTEVSDTVADHAAAVVAEALSNVARHARATSVDVHVIVRTGELILTVTDDGEGVAKGAARSGLANLEERARALGGSMIVERGPGGGTRLRWRVRLVREESSG